MFVFTEAPVPVESVKLQVFKKTHSRLCIMYIYLVFVEAEIVRGNTN